MRIDEDLAEAAYRELVEQTGIDGQVGHLEQLRTCLLYTSRCV